MHVSYLDLLPSREERHTGKVYLQKTQMSECGTSSEDSEILNLCCSLISRTINCYVSDKTETYQKSSFGSICHFSSRSLEVR